MKKSILKTCTVYDDEVLIKLEDIRDNYIYELALGDIGNIYISKEGLLINSNFDPNIEIQKLRDNILSQAIYEIFKVTDYNPLSSEYYNKIIKMIQDNTLEFLGYKIIKSNEEEINLILEYERFENYNQKQRKTH